MDRRILFSGSWTSCLCDGERVLFGWIRVERVLVLGHGRDVFDFNERPP